MISCKRVHIQVYTAIWLKVFWGMLKKYASVSCRQLSSQNISTLNEKKKKKNYLKGNLASCLILKALLRDWYLWLS